MHEAQSIKNFFEADHERLDQLFVSFMKFKNESFPRAVDYFNQWKSGLQRHIVWEENIIFPLFLKKTDNERPIRVMRFEHCQILQALDKLSEKVQRGNCNTDREEYQLLILLGEHSLKEEMVLYPSIEATLTEEEAADVFRKMDYLKSTDKRAS